MKKFLSALLAVVMLVGCVISFTACGGYDLYFGDSFSPLDGQIDVLIALNAKTIDVGIMDSVMANYYVSTDTAYADNLMVVDELTLATEQYGIAARKGSGLTKKINAALIELAKDGTVNTIATKYGLQSEICIDTTITVDALTDSEKADWEYLQGKGAFIVGYTEFKPIAYEDNDGNLTGFDIELAKAVAAKLGINVEFKLINWATKEAELNGKTIDCIWNGMTITEERQEQMEVSIPYMNNKQVAVIRKADKDLYKTTEDMKNAIIGAEDGSAGMSCVVKEEEE